MSASGLKQTCRGLTSGSPLLTSGRRLLTLGSRGLRSGRRLLTLGSRGLRSGRRLLTLGRRGLRSGRRLLTLVGRGLKQTLALLTMILGKWIVILELLKETLVGQKGTFGTLKGTLRRWEGRDELLKGSWGLFQKTLDGWAVIDRKS